MTYQKKDYVCFKHLMKNRKIEKCHIIKAKRSNLTKVLESKAKQTSCSLMLICSKTGTDMHKLA